jgi:hypothetical protein
MGVKELLQKKMNNVSDEYKGSESLNSENLEERIQKDTSIALDLSYYCSD